MIAHALGLKLSIAATAAAIAVVVIDPTVEVALITGFFLLLAQIPAFIVALQNRRDFIRSLSVQNQVHQTVNEVKENTNGVITELIKEKAQASVALNDAKDKQNETENQLSYVKGEKDVLTKRLES